MENLEERAAFLTDENQELGLCVSELQNKVERLHEIIDQLEDRAEDADASADAEVAELVRNAEVNYYFRYQRSVLIGKRKRRT